jgi:hypothetical protein
MTFLTDGLFAFSLVAFVVLASRLVRREINRKDNDNGSAF